MMSSTIPASLKAGPTTTNTLSANRYLIYTRFLLNIILSFYNEIRLDIIHNVSNNIDCNLHVVYTFCPVYFLVNPKVCQYL